MHPTLVIAITLAFVIARSEATWQSIFVLLAFFLKALLESTFRKKPHGLVSIFYSWDTARHQAGLADVRIHDLRHSFASFLVNAGRSLYEVQKILGHTQIKTTQRYAHLSQDTLIDAANVVPFTIALPLVSAAPAGLMQRLC